MNPWVVVSGVLVAVCSGSIFGMLRLWKRQGAVEQTLYGQQGEKGLATRLEALKDEVKDRDHATRGKIQEMFSELEARVRTLERLVPKRRSEQ